MRPVRTRRTDREILTGEVNGRGSQMITVSNDQGGTNVDPHRVLKRDRLVVVTIGTNQVETCPGSHPILREPTIDTPNRDPGADSQTRELVLDSPTGSQDHEIRNRGVTPRMDPTARGHHEEGAIHRAIVGKTKNRGHRGTDASRIAPISAEVATRRVLRSNRVGTPRQHRSNNGTIGSSHSWRMPNTAASRLGHTTRTASIRGAMVEVSPTTSPRAAEGRLEGTARG
jgi:hypothetical protein